MTRRILIVGAGGFGRGVFGWLEGSPRHRFLHGIGDVAFLDDGAPAAPLLAPIVSTVRGYVPGPRDRVVCAVADPGVRRSLVDLLRGRGARFHTFVDDRAVLGQGVVVGTGAVVCPGVVVSAGARIGDHVQVNFNCSVGHDVVLGAFTTLSPSVNIMGEVQVGESAFFGGSAVVLPRLAVGAGAVVGAGATIRGGVAAGTTVVGSDGRVIAGSGERPVRAVRSS
ncbi:hypothetical protein [Propionicicella superfundia]|uniref:hypothetical protein n=1 Tax=Propionicicella superfundia TaxID=348582 RepID=UPI0003F82E36|nr:hypothetical protein [Propionicicella superfundia]